MLSDLSTAQQWLAGFLVFLLLCGIGALLGDSGSCEAQARSDYSDMIQTSLVDGNVIQLMEFENEHAYEVCGEPESFASRAIAIG